MRIEDAITHHVWAAMASSGQVSEEHKQQAEWLAELVQVREENARYRELVEILRRDWRIEASWDGLRKVWYVGLTEDGVRERDERDAKVMEAANIEIGELRELVEVLVNCGRKYHTMNGSCPMFDAEAEADDFCGAVQAARELGIEVE